MLEVGSAGNGAVRCLETGERIPLCPQLATTESPDPYAVVLYREDLDTLRYIDARSGNSD